MVTVGLRPLNLPSRCQGLSPRQYFSKRMNRKIIRFPVREVRRFHEKSSLPQPSDEVFGFIRTARKRRTRQSSSNQVLSPEVAFGCSSKMVYLQPGSGKIFGKTREIFYKKLKKPKFFPKRFPKKISEKFHHVMPSSAVSNADFTRTGVTQHSMAAAIAIRKKITSPAFQTWPRINRQMSPGWRVCELPFSCR
jgi:hypothetical protein